MKIILELILLIIIKIIKREKVKKNIKKKKYLKRGEYMTKLGNCISCHTIEGGRPFIGGYSLKTKFGIVNSPNISSNKDFGIGNLKLKEFLKIMRNGISKNGDILLPILPYLNFCKTKKGDLKSIFFFFKKTKNEKMINKKNKLKFPIKYKRMIIG